MPNDDIEYEVVLRVVVKANSEFNAITAGAGMMKELLAHEKPEDLNMEVEALPWIGLEKVMGDLT
jgi:hypothetical protein